MNSNEFGSLEAIGILLTLIIAHLIIYLPERIISEIGSASLINVIYVIAIIFVFTFIVVKLFRNFSTCDILDVSYYLGGNLLKKTLSLLFVAYYIFFAGLFIRDFAESLKIIYFHDFNISIIIVFFLIASIVVNKFGLRKVVRCTFLIIPGILLTIVVVVIASAPEFTYQRVFPLLGYGAKQTFLVGLGTLSSFSNFLVLFYLLPLLKDKRKFKRISFISVAISGLLLFCTVGTLLLISNYTTTQSLLSIYLATRRISLGIFLKRADSLFVLIWILSMFSYLALTTALSYYIFNKARTNNKPTSSISLIIITALIWLVSVLPHDIAQLRFLENNVLKFVAISFIFVIHFLILIFGNIKLKFAKRKRSIRQTA